MKNRLKFALILFFLSQLLICFHFELVCASSADAVRNVDTGLSYSSIQSAIDAQATTNGHTISVSGGVYYEHVVVSKSVTLLGMSGDNAILDGNGTGSVIRVTADNVAIRNLTVRNGTLGIDIFNSSHSVMSGNLVTHNLDAIDVYYSTDTTVDQNIIMENTRRGILISDSSDFRVDNNTVHHNGKDATGYGINLNASSSGLVRWNDVYENYYDGIGLLETRDCNVIGNNVRNNTIYGIWVDSSNENVIYDNNLICNNLQARATPSVNHWDNSFEGNYWSDYHGVDLDHDGIGSISYPVETGNIDRYPLMGMFSSFETSTGSRVDLVSNSTVENYALFDSNQTIRIRISSNMSDQSYGFCRLRIPHELMTEPFTVSVDGVTPYYVNCTLNDDGHSRWLYLEYEYPADVITVQGFRAQDTTLLLVSIMLIVIAGTGAALIYFKKTRRTKWKRK